jgi:hypothetical protein
MRFKADIGESNIAALFKQVTLNRGRPMSSASETFWAGSRRSRRAAMYTESSRFAVCSCIVGAIL